MLNDLLVGYYQYNQTCACKLFKMITRIDKEQTTIKKVLGLKNCLWYYKYCLK